MPLQLNDDEMSVLMSLAGPIDQQRRPQSLQEVAAELVPVDADQKAIREMVALREQGKALRAIAEAVQAATRSATRAWRAS